MSRRARCHVTGDDCRGQTRGECFACGNPTCAAPSCSRRQDWYKHKRVRVCARCREDARRLEVDRA